MQRKSSTAEAGWHQATWPRSEVGAKGNGFHVVFLSVGLHNFSSIHDSTEFKG
jgi:hypothetical protein